MRFLSIYKHVEKDTPPSTEEFEKVGNLIEEWTKSGKLISTEGCLPSSKGARVRRAGTKYTVTDGPFTESKELVGGFALLEASSLEEAKELTKEFLEAVGDGECEIRQIATMDDFGDELTPEQRDKENRVRAELAGKS
jgi:hypothetical protein